jgi:hypothetical protein
MISDNTLGLLETPHSNTGSDRQTGADDTGLSGHPDYLVVVGITNIKELIQAIWAVFGTNFDYSGAKPGTRGNHYSIILKSAQTIELAYDHDPLNPNLPCRFRLCIPGAPLSHVRPEELAKLGRYLLHNGCRSTRFDYAIDDFDRQLSIQEIIDCCESGDYAGAQCWRSYRSQRSRESRVGQTIYLGSSQSDKQIRIYDKYVESRGAINSIRYEVQWRDRLAHIAFEKFFTPTSRSDANSLLSKLAVGAIDFISRCSEILSRCPRKSFWAEFLQRIGQPIKISMRRIQPMISDKKRWIEHQVVGTLALISSCQGLASTLDWLYREIIAVRERDSPGAVAWRDTWRDRVLVESGQFEDWQVIQGWDAI